ncbi:MAG TPA: DNA replication and repair protein RecF [Solirubrobacteraceae bacterium]|jgi:DNA replication and repair protein RecF|nr:DNA replication and repair protein RecF [Solirubrobacteraceae bacterium]
MRVVSVSVRNFRTYETAAAPLGGGLTVVWGPNGSGKTNLLEAIYFGCTGRSCRTGNDRELVRFGADTTRVVVNAEDDLGRHELTVGFSPGEPKRMTADGAHVERLLDAPQRPLVSVFLPDRLELVKGVPALRRAHLDQFVTALWPARAATRRAYAQALAQRNALIGRLRAGAGSRAALDAWDAQLAEAGLALMADRREAVELTAATFADACDRLALDGEPAIAYRPRSRAGTAFEFVDELRERIDGDLERGFTEHGPHRDDLLMTREGRALRTYGSQGQQRLGLLALLLAERRVIGEQRPSVPLMLLDDVMSELDRDRRAALVELLAEGGGQALITTTDLDHVPGVFAPGVARIAVELGRVAEDVTAEPVPR